MKNFAYRIAAIIFLCLPLASMMVSCGKDDVEDPEVYKRVLYSELNLPDDGSNGPQFEITDEDFESVANDLGVETEVLKAIWKVDTGGISGFIPDGNGGNLPTILFEGHIFWSQLRTLGLDPEDFVRGNEDILYKKWTKSHYVGGLGEWARLERAMAIHERAAYCSASWGMFQIMGFFYKSCGCATVLEFVDRMKKSPVDQLKLFAGFLKSNADMLKALKRLDWTAFAKLYYGSHYYEKQYDVKLSREYGRLKMKQ